MDGPTQIAPLPPEALVVYPYPCGRCGYDLLGLPRDSECPECGLPIMDSLAGHAVFHEDERYTTRLEMGSAIVETALAFLIVLHCVPVMSALTLLVSCLGWWWMGAPPPGESDDLADLRSRAARLRHWSLACASAEFAALLLYLLPTWLYGPHTAAVILAAGAVPLAGMAISGMRLLQALAARIPSRRVLRRAEHLKWLVVIWAASLVTVPAASALPYAPPGAQVPLSLWLPGMTIGWCVGVWMLFTLGAFRTALPTPVRKKRAEAPATTQPAAPIPAPEPHWRALR